MKQKREYDDDDGRTIADMSMLEKPWQSRPARKKRDNTLSELSGKERRALYRGILGAALLVALCITAVYFLIVFAMTRLW